MLKRLFLILAFAGLLSPVHAAGTIPFSLSQQLDNLGKPLIGCKFYTIQAGTTSTPQNAYQDSALTLPLPNPQTCDAAGRLPQMFLADGTIKVRLTTSAGVNVLTADGVQVVGNSSGGGGGGTVDPTTILATGDVKSRYGTGVLTGFVRMNGRTIGSATSGATERANADAQALFEYLWSNDANLVVSTGRGASANADWVANKTIALPDGRGRVLAALDDMGNSPAGKLTATFFGSAATTLGAIGGFESQLLTIAQMPVHNHSGLTGAMTGNQTHNHGYVVSSTSLTGGVWPGGGAGSVAQAGGLTENANIDHTHGIPSQGGGNAHPIVPPMILVTNYLKL